MAASSDDRHGYLLTTMERTPDTNRRRLPVFDLQVVPTIPETIAAVAAA